MVNGLGKNMSNCWFLQHPDKKCHGGRVASCRVASRRVVSRRVASRRVVSRRVASRRVVSRRVVSRRVASGRVEDNIIYQLRTMDCLRYYTF